MSTTVRWGALICLGGATACSDLIGIGSLSSDGHGGAGQGTGGQGSIGGVTSTAGRANAGKGTSGGVDQQSRGGTTGTSGTAGAHLSVGGSAGSWTVGGVSAGDGGSPNPSGGTGGAAAAGGSGGSGGARATTVEAGGSHNLGGALTGPGGMLNLGGTPNSSGGVINAGGTAGTVGFFAGAGGAPPSTGGSDNASAGVSGAMQGGASAGAGTSQAGQAGSTHTKTTFNLARDLIAQRGIGITWRLVSALPSPSSPPYLAPIGEFSQLVTYLPGNQFYGLWSWLPVPDRGANNISVNTTNHEIMTNYYPLPIPPYAAICLPGVSGEYVLVEWVAPSPGTVAYMAQFSGIDNATTDVHVFIREQHVFMASITKAGDRCFSAGTVSVAQGDVLGFAVGVGANGSNAFDETEIEVALELESP